ncbi:DUF445 domain-containing protein [Shewanella pealeana]
MLALTVAIRIKPISEVTSLLLPLFLDWYHSAFSILLWGISLNKSVITNLLAAILVAVGYLFALPIVLTVGLFALSGAVTNWLAIHMLFEKVPGLYGSGVIPSRFEEFKQAIANLMMKQFFTEENIDRFLSGEGGIEKQLNLQPVIDNIDLSPAFDALVTTVEQSSFGGMLAMFGGSDAITPLREPFIEKMKSSLSEIAQSEDFYELLKAELEQPNMIADMRAKVEEIVTQRLDELTPQLVKEIVQEMIREHLGWLVVWGGVFGGLIGLAAALIQG